MDDQSLYTTNPARLARLLRHVQSAGAPDTLTLQ